MDSVGGLLAVLAPIGVAYAAIATKPPHRSAAIVLFAIAALLAIGQIVGWGVMTNMSAPIRMIAVGLVGAIAAVGFTEALRYVRSMPSHDPQPVAEKLQAAPPSGDSLSATATVAEPNGGDTLAAQATVRDRPRRADDDAPARATLRAPNPGEDSRARAARLRQLTNLYMFSHDNITARMAAGTELPPVAFLNAELAREGAAWRVRKVIGANAETYDLRATPQVTSEQRDPDGLYQSGKLVASVEQSQIVPSEGRVFFGVIKDQGKLVPNLPVEYRNYVLDLGLPVRPATPGTVVLNQSIASVGINARIIGTH